MSVVLQCSLLNDLDIFGNDEITLNIDQLTKTDRHED